jgi:hypothetical protein
MANAGAAQRGLQQQALDVDYQNYLTQQQYPYQQLAFMQGMYSGLPLSQQTASHRILRPRLWGSRLWVLVLALWAHTKHLARS